jgi:pimeloyl-ACP methyl ester carboxylesterase
MKLHHRILGEGEPLIIMHGVFGMSDNWQSLGRKWAESYQVHLLDLRNHGRTEHSDEFSYSLMADDIAEHLDRYNLDRANLLGHSMGGKVAMLFATLYPQRTAALIVADIAPKYYPPHHQKIINALQSLPVDEISSRSEAEDLFDQSLEEGIRQFLLKSLYWKSKGQLAWRFNLPVIARSLEQVGEPLPPNAIFEGKTLFIRGGASNYITDEDLYEIQAHFPEAKLETIEEAGHWLHAQKPKEFKSCVDRFLAG